MSSTVVNSVFLRKKKKNGKCLKAFIKVYFAAIPNAYYCEIKTLFALCSHRMQQGISATQRKMKFSTDIVRQISETFCIPKHITFYFNYFTVARND